MNWWQHRRWYRYLWARWRDEHALRVMRWFFRGRVLVIALDDYEAVNLKSALLAHRVDSPLAVLNSGDWTEQVIWKLEQELEQEPAFAVLTPNVESADYAQRAETWRALHPPSS